MTLTEDLKAGEVLLEKLALQVSSPEENRIDITIKPEDIKSAVNKLLYEGHWGYLSAITALDNPEYQVDETTKEKKVIPGKGSLELLYHFCRGAAVATLRVALPYTDPSIDSICDILSSATLYEREASELLGIHFRGTPNTDHLILPDNWPDGVYPLRKSFTSLQGIQSPEEGVCS